VAVPRARIPRHLARRRGDGRKRRAQIMRMGVVTGHAAALTARATRTAVPIANPKVDLPFELVAFWSLASAQVLPSASLLGRV
jgi:hypothetical protein